MSNDASFSHGFINLGTLCRYDTQKKALVPTEAQFQPDMWFRLERLIARHGGILGLSENALPCEVLVPPLGRLANPTPKEAPPKQSAPENQRDETTTTLCDELKSLTQFQNNCLVYGVLVTLAAIVFVSVTIMCWQPQSAMAAAMFTFAMLSPGISLLTLAGVASIDRMGLLRHPDYLARLDRHIKLGSNLSSVFKHAFATVSQLKKPHHSPEGQRPDNAHPQAG